MTPRLIRRAALALTLVFSAGCGGGTDSEDDGRLYVVATTTMIADAAKEIGGDLIRLKPLMKPGVDPHLFEPTTPDAISLHEADLIFYNGHYLEGQMEKTLKGFGEKSVAVAESTPMDQLIQDTGSGHADPHVWGNVALWADCLQVVADALAKKDPDNAEAYLQKGRAVVEELRELDKWVGKRVSEIPKNKRILVTSHDAFNYFGQAYGFEVLGMQGISTVDEVGLAERVAMVDYIKEKGVKAIFIESSVSPSVIESVSNDAGVKIGGELFSDALGRPGTIEDGDGESYDVGTYPGMIRHNVNAIVDALR